MMFTNESVKFADFDGTVSPLRCAATLTAPSLPAPVTTALLALADEVRDARLKATGAKARRKLLDIGFEILRLAASPGIPGEEGAGDAAGPCEEARMSTAEIKELVERKVRPLLECQTPYEGAYYDNRGGMTGGDREAQYRVGIYYATGRAVVCKGKPLWHPAAFWMMQSGLQGYEPARVWLREHGLEGMGGR